LLAKKRRDCEIAVRDGTFRLKIASSICHASRCAIGIVEPDLWRFSGHDTHSARKMQLYADIRRCNSEQRWATISVLYRRVRVCKRCALAWVRRHAGCMRTSEAAPSPPCMHPRNICKYTYTCTSCTWSTLCIYMSTTAYARTYYVYTYILRTHT